MGEKLTVEEFFEWQRRQDENYELVDGIPVLTVKAMTGASDRHDAVTVNTIIALGQAARQAVPAAHRRPLGADVPGHPPS